jgi:deoxyribodipyrimidine photo-lyase
MAKKHGNKIFQFHGVKGDIEPPSNSKIELFSRWADGRTGNAFVDANMRELNLTGYMSNRGRLNVASYLIHDMGMNWIMGAEYFESLLLDYDPCSNYGNWSFIAGVGADSRTNKQVNTLNEARRYDPHATFVKLWMPEFASLSIDQIFGEERLSPVDV